MEAKYYGFLGIMMVLVLVVTFLTHNTNPESANH